MEVILSSQVTRQLIVDRVEGYRTVLREVFHINQLISSTPSKNLFPPR